MADISKVTLPDGTSYNIKDTTARNTGKVSGVKGSAESSYRTGNVNLTAENLMTAYGNGTTDPWMRSLIDQTRANRLAFLPASQIIIEQTTDGGTTWTSANYSDTAKTSLFSEINQNIAIPLLNGAKSALCGTRITITGMRYDVPSGTSETGKYAYWNTDHVLSQERYFNVREWWFWVSSNNDTIRVQIERATGAKPNNWVNVFNTDFGLNGWSGSDWIRAGAGQTFGGGTNQTANSWNWRLTFWSRLKDGETAFGSNTQQIIQQIRCYGDSVWGAPYSLMARDHLYTWDYQANATFPAKVTATGFTGPLTGNASTATEFSANKSVVLTGDVTGSASSKGGWSVATTLANSGVSAGSYGPSADASPSAGGTFSVPYVTFDAKGRATAASAKTITLPTDASTVNGHTVNADVPSGAVFTDTTYSNATSSAAGLMSATDKSKLDTLLPDSGPILEDQIGSRNLVLASENEITETTNSTSAAMLTNYWMLSDYAKQQLNEMKAEQVVMSFEAKSDTAGAKYNSSIRGASSSNSGYRSDASVTLTTTWTRYTKILTRHSSADNFDCTRLWGVKYAAVNGETSTIYIRNVKLELGACATDYAPAPEEGLTGGYALPDAGVDFDTITKSGIYTVTATGAANSSNCPVSSTGGNLTVFDPVCNVKTGSTTFTQMYTTVAGTLFIRAHSTTYGYKDWIKYAKIDDIPTSVSAFTNDSGYQTESNVVALMALMWNEIGNGPLIYHDPTDQTAAVNDKAYFHVDALGVGTITYQWQYSTDSGATWSNTTFLGNKTDTVQVTATTARNGYQYRCNVTSSGKTVASNAATLHVS